MSTVGELTAEGREEDRFERTHTDTAIRRQECGSEFVVPINDETEEPASEVECPDCETTDSWEFA